MLYLRTALGMASAKGELSLVVAKGSQDVGDMTSTVLPILGVVTTVYHVPIYAVHSLIRIDPSYEKVNRFS